MELDIYETQSALEMEQAETSYQIILGMIILAALGLMIHDVCSCVSSYTTMRAELDVLEYVQKANKKRICDLEEQIETLKEENAKLTDDLNTLKTIKMDELIEKVASLDKTT